MGLTKFITVFDDIGGDLLSPENMKGLDISAVPCVFGREGALFIDDGSAAEGYIRDREAGLVTAEPYIPSRVFSSLFTLAYSRGTLTIFVFCPHSRLGSYYKNACDGKRRFFRSGIFDDPDFAIHIVNTKTFGAGMLYSMITTAQLVCDRRCPTNIALAAAVNRGAACRDLMLQLIDGVFVENENHGGRLSENSLFGYSEKRALDRFTMRASEVINRINGEYAVSMSAGCSFSGDVLGQIEMKAGASPTAGVTCSVPGAEAIRGDGLCIHCLN